MKSGWQRKLLAAGAAAILTGGMAWAESPTPITLSGDASVNTTDGSTSGITEALTLSGERILNNFALNGHTLTFTGNGSPYDRIAGNISGESGSLIFNVQNNIIYVSGAIDVKNLTVNNTGTGIIAFDYEYRDVVTHDTLTINNASLHVCTCYFKAPNITITLGSRNESVGGADDVDHSALLVSFFDTLTGSNIKISGGEIGKKYGVIAVKDLDAEDAAFTAKLRNSGFGYKYDIEYQKYQLVSAWGVYFATVTGIEEKKIEKAACADSSANRGLGQALAELYNAGDLAPEMKAVIDALEEVGQTQGAKAYGRAVTALNGANSAAGEVQVCRNAVSEFNSALGSVFGERHMARVAAGGAERQSASAGGVPLTLVAQETAAMCDPLYTGWVKVYGGFGGVDKNRATTGYSFGGVGVMTGIDRKIGNELTLGALFGWSFNRSEINRGLGDATDNILRLGVYGDFNWNSFFFNATPSFGIHMLESERRIAFLGETAKSERTGFDFNLYNKAGCTYEFCDGLMLTPSYALGMTYMQDPAHREHGAHGANLRVRDYDSWSLAQNLELKLGYAFNLNGRVTLLPEIWGGWEHEYLESNDVSMNFAAAAGTSWKAEVSDIAADRAVFGAGVKTLVGDRWEIDARYDQKIWDGGYNTNFSLGASVKF